ncbi:MAG: hypothetical protein JW942_02210 [Opitutales bacterium]|nr:hypothetical protein [Opitutales bacterium]
MNNNVQRIRQKVGTLTGRESQDRLPARPEMLERGRRLLANPDYPDMSVCRALAGEILPLLYQD